MIIRIIITFVTYKKIANEIVEKIVNVEITYHLTFLSLDEITLINDALKE